MKVSRFIYKRFFNLWPPYLGAGVKIDYIDKSWLEMKVSMKLRFYNQNIKRTHFGGSLYSMIDPHFMLMLMQVLGQDYVVWDKAADIEFIKPGTGKVHAVFKIDKSTVETIRKKTETGEKYLPEFIVDIKNENGDLVSRVKKIVYVRKKKGR